MQRLLMLLQNYPCVVKLKFVLLHLVIFSILPEKKIERKITIAVLYNSGSDFQDLYFCNFTFWKLQFKNYNVKMRIKVVNIWILTLQHHKF